MSVTVASGESDVLNSGDRSNTSTLNIAGELSINGELNLSPVSGSFEVNADFDSGEFETTFSPSGPAAPSSPADSFDDITTSTGGGGSSSNTPDNGGYTNPPTD